MMTKAKILSLNREARQTHASSFRKQVPNPDRRGPASLVAKHVSEELFQLQLEQFRHDEIYHREISRLTVHQRLNHTALHFSKYAGQIAEICHKHQEFSPSVRSCQIARKSVICSPSIGRRVLERWKPSFFSS